MKLLDRLKLKINHYYRALGVKGVILFIICKITRYKSVVCVKNADIKQPVFLRIGTTDISTYMQVIVERQYEFDEPESARFIIDAGANIGLSAVYFANRFPDAIIIAIEPEYSNFVMLCKNSASYHQIKPVHAALWCRNEILNLFDSGHGNHGFRTSRNMAISGVSTSRIEGKTIESIMEEAGQTDLDILKIDIEGSECEVLEASETWIEKVRVIMIELHNEINPRCSTVFAKAVSGFRGEATNGETIMRFR